MANLASLPVDLALEPMGAKVVAELPDGPGWQYEPKWDGFRCLAFKAGDEVELMGRSGKSLARFFPDMVAAVRSLAIDRMVADGELVIQLGDTLVLRCTADAPPSGSQPGKEACRRASGALDPVRLPDEQGG